MHERWNEIYQLMEIYLALITSITSLGSLIFVWLGYKLAKGFLDQHREKVKHEQKQKIIIDCIQLTYKLKSNFLQYYGIPNYDVFDVSNSDEIGITLDWIINQHIKRSDYFISIDNQIHELRAYFLILNNDELNSQIERFPKIINKLNSIYYEITFYRSEHLNKKAWEIVVDLEELDAEKNPKNVLLLSFKALNILANDLVSLYQSDRIYF